MFKYDDIISTLTLVNTLAKDVDYGYVKQGNLLCNMEQSTSKIYYCVIVKYCDLRVRYFYNKTISKIHNLNFIKFKGFCKSIFFKLKKDFIIFLQKILLYCEHLKLEYG